VQLFERCQTNVREAAWVQLQHLCLYEIGWCRYFQLDYAAAIPLFTQLQAENSWSKAFYAYMVAVSPGFVLAYFGCTSRLPSV
jgi:hypothetical protein